MKCKVTNNKIEPFMSFGKMPIANGFIEKKDFKNEFFYNMEVGFSEELSLLQLNDHPEPKSMFNEKYPFFTSSSNYMKIHFKKYAEWISQKYLKSNSNLIEIGSNDGTFLKNFKDKNINAIGFEPSKNVADKAILDGVKTYNNFFNLKNIQLIKENYNKIDVICASNVICHIPDLNDLISSLDKLLSKNGVFIFEEPYMGSMFKKTSYDQIYDEHIYMFSLSSVKKIFKLFNFELVDVVPQETHGGSMRYIIARAKNTEISNRVKIGLENEIKNNYDNIKSCLEFKKNCEVSKEKINTLINKYKNEGKSICGYAATSKSTTILNYCGINQNSIDFICDTTPEKIGKYSPGTHIPIVPMSHFYNNLTDIVYLFAWNHKDEIFEKEKNKIKNDIKWISHVDL
jgi:methylation protein EvaC